MSGMPARPDPPAPHRLGMAEANRRPGPGGTRPAPLDVLVVAGPLDEDSHDVGGALPALPAVSPRRRAARLHALPATRRQADGCAAGGPPLQGEPLPRQPAAIGREDLVEQRLAASAAIFSTAGLFTGLIPVDT